MLAGVVEGYRAAGIDDKAGPLIDPQRLWVIEGRGVQPEAIDWPRPGAVDRRLQEIGAEPAPDEIGDEPEIAELGLARCCGVELEKAGGHATHVEDKDFDRRLVDLCSECQVADHPALEPQPRLADGVVEIAVER